MDTTKSGFEWFGPDDCIALKNHLKDVLSRLDSYDYKPLYGINETTIKTIIISQLISTKDLNIVSEYELMGDVEGETERIEGFKKGQKYCDLLVYPRGDSNNQFVLIEIKYVSPRRIYYNEIPTGSNGDTLFKKYILPQKQQDKGKTSGTNRDELLAVANAFKQISLSDKDEALKIPIFGRDNGTEAPAAGGSTPGRVFDRRNEKTSPSFKGKSEKIRESYMEALMQLEDYCYHFKTTRKYGKNTGSKVNGLLVFVIGNEALVELI